MVAPESPGKIPGYGGGPTKTERTKPALPRARQEPELILSESAIRVLGPGNVSGICPRDQDIDTREQRRRVYRGANWFRKATGYEDES